MDSYYIQMNVMAYWISQMEDEINCNEKKTAPSFSRALHNIRNQSYGLFCISIFVENEQDQWTLKSRNVIILKNKSAVLPIFCVCQKTFSQTIEKWIEFEKKSCAILSLYLRRNFWKFCEISALS